MSSYETDTLKSGTHEIPAFVLDKRSERLVNRFYTSFLAFPMLALAITFVSAYPTPGDVVAAFQGAPGEKKPVMTGAEQNVEATVATLSRQASPAAGLYADQAAAENCFSDLAAATKAKLDRCSQNVYLALVEVQRNMGEPRVMQALGEPDAYKLVSNLQLAAAEVCRLRWTRGGDAELDNPACEVSGQRLASRN